MSATYEFDWDADKAAANERKHGVRFEQALTIFRDPLALTVYDKEHSETEERWATIGLAEGGLTIVVVHTFTPRTPGNALIRLISAREATKRERQQYEDG
ncbi:MAG TPA: BrnT family toxin [Acidiferrobacterales bacterium]|nr:BrnT family toxin [Acidiferrobacterales bacterium]